MTRLWISVSFAACAALSILPIGCQDECTNATNRIAAVYKACDLTVSPTTGTVTTATCTAADAAYADCRATCAEAASCKALHATDPQAAADFGKCNAACK